MPRPYSINQRTLLATTLLLVCFLGFAGSVLDLAFRDSAAEGSRQKLETTLYGLLAVAEVTEAQQLSIPNFLTDERFNRPDSGLYALITDAQNKITWQSKSLLGENIPTLQNQKTGERAFYRVNHARPYFVYSAGIAWEIGNQQQVNYNFHILSSTENYAAQVTQFRQSLWGWLATIAIMLTVIQLIILRWSLSPLRQVAADLLDVESGKQNNLSGNYPKELEGLTQNLNHLLNTRESQLRRSRDALANLAHSLKTPLAIIRGINVNSEDEQILQEQSDRMTQIVDYQLQRAATAGHTGLTSGVVLKPVIERISGVLSKVYSDKSIRCELDMPDDLILLIEENDLMELAGNLMDNAYKWAEGHVQVSAYSRDNQTHILFEDDGPGIDAKYIDRVMQRGARADLAVDGQGIGLAVCKDIVDAYQGSINITQGKLNGACITVTLNRD